MKIKDLFHRLSNWETWHHHVKYIPLAPVWAWYCIRSGTPWFFTASNPTLTFGGFEGEGKQEMYEQLPPGTYPHSIYIKPGIEMQQLKEQIAAAGFSYPFIAKPDVGMMGFMVRRIQNDEQLAAYHGAMPDQYIIQTLVEYPVEVAAFYYRMPNEKKGTLSGLLQKQPAFVVGDGISTLEDLINANEQVRHKVDDILGRHKAQLKKVISKGEVFPLSVSSNRSQAGIVQGVDHLITEELNNRLDEWSHYSGKLYYGRYDIKCASVASLQQGKDFYILEFNGAGAGIQHITGNNYSLFTAWKIILKHWKMLYLISRENAHNGVAYWGVRDGAAHLKKAKRNLQFLKSLDASFPSF
ncbi:MAG: hypothetical protein EOO03_00325 [Chitinophagaceae bacterium]|nr:MAG: hypothetical protein EOO03_00325 [Chitinophagaceae bacterium]